MIRYRITDLLELNEEWVDDPAAADAAVGRRLGIDAGRVERLRRRVTVDPVVVRREGARWRSRQIWSVRSDDVTIRIFEMLQIDEAVYDH
jgi:hypothetical protein